nr:transposase family protein [Exiguobacterium flavidum]
MEESQIRVEARLSSNGASCPRCGCHSSRRHSLYTRTWMDVPEGAMPVSVRLALPKWFCDEKGCAQSVFAERLEWLPSYNRRSSRLDSQIRALAFSMSALQTERVCSQFGIRISHDAVLRLVYKTGVDESASPFRRNR